MKHQLLSILFLIISAGAHVCFSARSLTESFSPADLANILNSLPPDDLAKLVKNIDPSKLPPSIPRDAVAELGSNTDPKKTPALVANITEGIDPKELPDLVATLTNGDVAGLMNLPKLEDFKVKIPDISLPPISSPKLPHMDKILHDLHVPSFVVNMLNKSD